MKIIRRLSMIFSFLAILFSFLARWLLNTWGNISMEGIVFHLKVPLTGTSNEYIYGFILNVLIPTFILYIIIYIFILLVLKNYLIFEIIIKKINKKIYFNLFGIHSKIYYQVVFLLSIFIINISIGYVIGKLDIKEYLKNQMTNSPFIEENYINPDDVNLIFPKNKQNLIYIFLESMESSYTDIENGGGIYVKLNNDLYPHKIRFSYIARPAIVQFNDDNEGVSVDCNLPEYMHIDIVKHAVDLYHIALQGSLMSAQQAEQAQQRENVRNNARNDN